MFEPEREAEGGDQDLRRVIRRKKRRKPEGDAAGAKKENWVTKYRPEFFSDLMTSEHVNLEVGEITPQCLKWLVSWRCSANHLDKYGDPENRILLIGGPSGSGKTSLVNVLARHCGYNVVEINASDDRTKGRVIPIINGVVSAGSVDPKRPNLCLLEDVDTLVGSEHSIIAHLRTINAKSTKGQPFIRRWAALTRRPIICTCSDVYARQLKELRDVAKVVVIEPCEGAVLQARLEAVLEEEGVVVPDENLREIQEMCRHDIRSCLTVLEFLAKHRGFSIANLTRDNNDGVEKLLQALIADREPSLPKLETLLTSSVNSIGYNYAAAAVAENATALPALRFDHLWRLAVFEDVLAQSDVVCNRPGSPAHAVQLLKVCCAFLTRFILNKNYVSMRFVYPQKTGYHWFNMRGTKARNVLHALRKAASPLAVQSAMAHAFPTQVMPFVLHFLSGANRALASQSLPFVLRVVKGECAPSAGLEGCWEGLFPYGSLRLPMSIFPLVHATQIMALLGVTVASVNQAARPDPPVFELYLATDSNDYFHQVPERFAQLVGKLVEFYRTGNKSYFTDDTHFKGASSYRADRFSNFFEAVKFIHNRGFAAFSALNREAEAEAKEAREPGDVVCKRTHADHAPVLFAQIVLGDSELLRALAQKRRDVTRTCGSFKYQDQNCSAVRYIVNNL